MLALPSGLPSVHPRALAQTMEAARRLYLQRRQEAKRKEIRYTHYQDNPVGFIRDILGVEVIPSDIMSVCNSVRDNPVTIARSGNGTGKTHIAAHLAIWFWACFPGAQVFTTAPPPESNLKNLLWGKIGEIIENSPAVFSGCRTSMFKMRIARSSAEFVSGVLIPNSGTSEQRIARFSGKHAPHLMFIVDEGDAVPQEVYTGIESCMSGGYTRLLILFNPRSKIGPVWRKERDRQANVVELTAFSHPNVIEGQEIVPGAVDRETTVRRINEWSRPLAVGEDPDAQCFDVPTFLAGCTAKSQDGQRQYPPLLPGTRKITDQALNYMVLARYPAQGSQQLISEEDIAKARSRWDAYVAVHGEKPPVGVKGVMAQDVSEFGDDSNANCRRYGGYVSRFQTWSGVDTEVTSDRAARIYLEGDIENVFVDGTGVGAGVAPSMIRKVRKANPKAPVRKIESVKVASASTYATELGEFGVLRDQLWWSVREWLRTDPGAMLPPDEELLEELLVATYEVVGKNIKIMDKPTMRKMLGRSPDRADSLCLTFTPAGRSFKLVLV